MASGCSYQKQDKTPKWFCLTVLLVQLTPHLIQGPYAFALVYSTAVIRGTQVTHHWSTEQGQGPFAWPHVVWHSLAVSNYVIVWHHMKHRGITTIWLLGFRSKVWNNLRVLSPLLGTFMPWRRLQEGPLGCKVISRDSVSMLSLHHLWGMSHGMQESVSCCGPGSRLTRCQACSDLWAELSQWGSHFAADPA